MPPKKQPLTKEQLRKLKRLAIALDEKNPVISKHIFEVEDALESKIASVEAKIPDVQGIVDAVKIKRGEKGEDGKDGKDGENYILTKQDRQDIADSVKVPVVEKVIEKTETVIREIPLVTNKVVEKIIEKEIAVPDDATIGYLEDKIDSIQRNLETIKKDGETASRRVISGGITKKIVEQMIDGAGGVKDTIGITVDGAGTALTTGTKGYRYIEQGGTITGWHVSADVSGSIVFDVKRGAASLAGTEKPTLSSQQYNSDLSLSSWTTSLSAGDIIEFVIDSATTVTRATLTVLITKT